VTWLDLYFPIDPQTVMNTISKKANKQTYGCPQGLTWEEAHRTLANMNSVDGLVLFIPSG